MSTNNLQPGSNFGTMSGMSTYREAGTVNILLVALIAAGVIALGLAGFGLWAFGSRQDYKNNSDKKSAAASAVTKEQTQKDDAAQYAEEAKNPLKTHVGPDAFGSVTIQYPKTWSGYVIEHNNNSGTPMNDYFNPDLVHDTTDVNNAYALRVQIVQTSYSQVMSAYKGLAESKKVAVAPYKLPKVPSVVGSRVDGQIAAQKQGSMIVLPLRNMTLEISTESQDFEPDFNTIILPNLTFSP
ncbi:MAG TPA: hypothetical protein VLH86_03550 [Patescibacteria group bacterium]|nr:hypothetical protein [Patescibacteria group bacterium]